MGRRRIIGIGSGFVSWYRRFFGRKKLEAENSIFFCRSRQQQLVIDSAPTNKWVWRTGNGAFPRAKGAAAVTTTGGRRGTTYYRFRFSTSCATLVGGACNIVVPARSVNFGEDGVLAEV